MSAPGVGTQLGSYRIEAVLGRGGMGVVYRAEDLRLGRKVALKLLASHLTEDVRFRARFLAESRLAASLDHAGIVPVYEAGETDGQLYIAMRYVEGTDLASLLRHEAPLAPDRAVDLVRQLAEALDAAHARGLVHRDVKPSNALIAREGAGEHVYLADFGLTKQIATTGGVTAGEQLVGTIDYLAPERIRGEQADGRADLYSLGCVLFECVTGEVPFPRDSEVAAIYAHLEDEPPRASERRPGAPAALDAVIEQAIAKDPERRWQTGSELAAAAQAALAGTRGPDTARRRVRRAPRPALLAVALAVITAATAGALLLTHSTGGPTPAVIDTNAVAVIDPGRGSLTHQVHVGAAPAQIAAGAGAVWVTNGDEGTVSRIDPRTDTVRDTIVVGSGPGAIAVADGGVWVVNSLSGTLSWINPSTDRVVKAIPVGNGPSGVCAGGGAIWVANSDDHTIWRIDPTSGRPTRSIPLDVAPTQLACGGGDVWASSESTGKATEIDAHTGDVVQGISVGNGASGIAYGARALWVTNTLDGTLSRIDPRRGVATTSPIGPSDGPASVAADDHSVWVSNESGGTVVRIDPARGMVLKRLTVGNRPQGLALVNGALWVGVAGSGAQHRGGTLRTLSSLTFGTADFDPAVSNGFVSFPLLNLTNDGLTAFRRVGGRQGRTLVPDLAVSLPAATDGGRTYRFQVRAGIRYSTGEPVRPADIRRGLERAFHGGSASLGAAYFSGIVGATACVRRPTACDLSRGIVVDGAAGTITFHLTAPDPDFCDKLALPSAVAVPPAAGAVPLKRTLPATGPYVIARLVPNRLVRLVRNPHFHAWSSAAKPDGYPDEITVEEGVKQSAAVQAVERGTADYVFLAGRIDPSKERDALYTHYAAQVHTNSSSVLVSFFLNTRTAPFDNIDARRAVNYAVDRHAGAEVTSGAGAAAPTCQILPPNFPGYRRYCPFTAHPGSGRPWSAPDLAKANELIARSHTRGMHVTVWAPTVGLDNEARFLVPVLDKLGYRASLRLIPDRKYIPYIADSRHRAQVGVFALGADYPAARDFLQVYFSCRAFTPDSPQSANWSEYCDPGADRLMDRALRLQTTDAAVANELWARAERRLVNRAVGVPLDNPTVTDVVSPRVRNYQYSPQWGILIDQLWLR